MSRPVRIEYENALYHVISRGNARQKIFLNDDNRIRFLKQLKDNLTTYGVILYAYVLMDNHYHLLLKTPKANLSRFMQRLNTSYSLYFRYIHNKPGHCLQGRYKAKLIESDAYLNTVSRYIHLNPVKVEEISKLSVQEKKNRLNNYFGSSYRGYVKGDCAQDFIDYSLLKELNPDTKTARKLYRHYVYSAISEDDAMTLEMLNSSIVAIGSFEFIKEVEKKIVEKKRGDHRDRDIEFPERYIGIDEIDLKVMEHFGKKIEKLKKRQRRDSVVKKTAVELACRLTGLNQRQIGEHYGGISSMAVSMIRKNIRESGLETKELVEVLEKELREC